MPAAIAKTTEAKSMAAAKPAKEKKVKPAASKAASSPPSHPPYFEMIKEAITVLHERTGSSAYAIAKHMEDKYKGKLPANFKKILANQLKGFAAKGKLVKVKASFKLSDSGKKEDKPVKKPAVVKVKKLAVMEKVKKPAVMEKVKKVKKTEGVKAGTKRKAPVAAAKVKKTVAKSPKKVKKSPVKKVKKPKSIKSPATKKARVSKA